jgi:WD40 repeat protein
VESKLSKSIVLILILILIVAAAILILRSGISWSFVKDDLKNPPLKTPTIATTVAFLQPTTPLATIAPVNTFATSIPNTGQMKIDLPCFIFEQLPPVAFLPDDSGLMVRVSSGVQVFNLATGSLEAFIKSSQGLTAVELSPDGETLAWALMDNTIQLVRVSDQQVLHTLSGPTDMVTKLRFTPGGDLLVSASHDHWVRVWNLSGALLSSFQLDALGIGISPDGKMLATIPFDGPVVLWDLATGEKIKDFGGTGGYDTSDAVFSSDGQYLAADLASSLSLWRISDASLVWNSVKNSMAVAFSPDGQYLAYSDIDDGNKVILASADTGQYMREIDMMQSPVWDLLFSPDSSLLAITDGRGINIRHDEDGALLAVGKTACP